MRQRLAIVIPVYNRKDFLFTALESISAQTLSPGWTLNIVVVDDGSSDGLSEDPRLLLFTQHLIRQTNAERGAARNRGARFAIDSLKSDWLLFFDSDDYMIPGALQAIKAQLAQAEDAVAVYSAIQSWDGGTRPEIQAARLEPSGDLSRIVLSRIVLPLGATVVRAEIFSKLGGFSEDRKMVGSEDFQFLFRVAQSGKILYVPVTSVFYRRHSQNTNPTNYLRSVSIALESLRSQLSQADFKKLQRLGTICQIGALAQPGFAARAAAILFRSVVRSPQLLFERSIYALSWRVVRLFLAG